MLENNKIETLILLLALALIVNCGKAFSIRRAKSPDHSPTMGFAPEPQWGSAPRLL